MVEKLYLVWIKLEIVPHCLEREPYFGILLIMFRAANNDTCSGERWGNVE
jgi:hypothetical protein